ncbi:pyridoxamine 5'-phosphate oxidase family protein [Angustibacter aerolatus]
MSDDSRADDVRKVAELARDIRIGMVTTVDADGTLVSRPMTLQETEFDGDLWFLLHPDSRLATSVRAGSRVNVALSSRSSWVSIAGTGEVLRDTARAKDYWNPMLSAWFEDGPEGADVALLKVAAESAEYWDSPGSTVTTLLQLARTRLTGRPYEGEHDVVELPQDDTSTTR